MKNFTRVLWSPFILVPLLVGAEACNGSNAEVVTRDGGAGGCSCRAVYDPVCGVDGNTYGNACMAECESVEVADEGACEGDAIELCGPEICEAGQVCCNESCGTCTEPGGACTQAPCNAT